MVFESGFSANEPTRAALNACSGLLLIEFGAPWCAFCLAAQPCVAEALARHPQVRQIKIEDGSGRRLGRSFGVKLWPTLIFMRDGVEVARLVRPVDAEAISEVLEKISAE